MTEEADRPKVGFVILKERIRMPPPQIALALSLFFLVVFFSKTFSQPDLAVSSAVTAAVFMNLYHVGMQAKVNAALSARVTNLETALLEK